MPDDQLDIAAIPQTALKVLTSPAVFFREMPKTGGFVAPLVFMVAMGVVGGAVRAALSLLHLNLAGAGVIGVASVIVLPIMIAIFGFVGAAIVFVIWKLLGSSESYETAYRCVAYMAALTPINTALHSVPYAGSIVSPVLSTFLIVMASIEVHRLSATKSWSVFGALGAILIVVGVSGELAAKRMGAGMAEMLKIQTQMQAQRQILLDQAQAMQKAAQRQAQSAAQPSR